MSEAPVRLKDDHFAPTPPRGIEGCSDQESESRLAVQVLETFAALGDRDRRSPDDGTLADATDLQDQLMVFTPREMSFANVRKLNYYAANWQAAMPFTSSEWNLLLLERWETTSRIDNAEVSAGEVSASDEQQLRTETQTAIGHRVLLHCGVQQTGDLVEMHARWDLWRRQDGIYEVSDSLKAARTALLMMSSALPNRTWFDAITEMIIAEPGYSIGL